MHIDRATYRVPYLDHLSPGLRMMSATRHLESELGPPDVGGFDRYFARFGGSVALKAMQGYRLIGAECHAEIVESALALFLCGNHDLREYRVLDDAFRDLDPPRPLKLEYVEAHPEEFPTCRRGQAAGFGGGPAFVGDMEGDSRTRASRTRSLETTVEEG